MKIRNYHIPIFVPHLGCPHDCVFCNQRHITGTDSQISAADSEKIIEENLKTIPCGSESYIEIAFFGGSFTGIEFEKQTELLQVAYKYLSAGKVHGIRCSTRPDCIDRKILDNLKKYGVTCIELGVQSTDDNVLRLSRRGHTFGDVKKACSLIKEYKISLGLQMMIGLPGDTAEKTVKTASDIIALNPDCVRIYPTLVVEDTSLYGMFLNGSYAPLSVEEAVERLSVIIPMFNRADIDIIRVGLQTTDEINAQTVNGPYHPAIKEMAESRIILRAIERNLPNTVKDSTLEISCNPSAVSKVIGHKRCNAEYFKKKYGVKMLVAQDVELSENCIKMYGKIIDVYA